MSGFKHALNSRFKAEWDAATERGDSATLNGLWMQSVYEHKRAIYLRSERAEKRGTWRLISNMFMRPSDRVWRVMRRISRDRFLCPDEVETIGQRMVELTGCGNSWVVFRAACLAECTVVGMYRGEPIFEKGTRERMILMESFDKKPTGRAKTLSEKQRTNHALNALISICEK